MPKESAILALHRDKDSPMGAWQIARQSWQFAFTAIRRNLPVFAVAIIVLSISGIVLATQQPVIVNGMTPAQIHAAAPGAKLMLLSLIGTLVQVLVQTPCAVAVHRYVLLGETGDQRLLDNRPRLIRFGLCLLALNLMVLLPSLLLILLGRLAAGHLDALLLLGAAGFALMVAGLIISVRLVLTLPGSALDGREPWAASWNLSRGHWWKTVWVFLATLTLPLLAFGTLQFFLQRAGLLVPVGVLNGIVGVVVIAVGAATASLLYRTFGGVIVPPSQIW